MDWHSRASVRLRTALTDSTGFFAWPVSRRRRDNTTAGVPGLFGVAAEILTYGQKIIGKFARVFLSLLSNFSHNRVVFHGRTINCSGVTIRGALHPKLSHACLILSVNAALAKWRQFQVKRKSGRSPLRAATRRTLTPAPPLSRSQDFDFSRFANAGQFMRLPLPFPPAIVGRTCGRRAGEV